MENCRSYFTDGDIWQIENDELVDMQSDNSETESIRYNFDKRRFSGAITENDFGINFANWKEANRNEIKLKEFQVIQDSMKNLTQDIAQINKTISNNRAEILDLS